MDRADTGELQLLECSVEPIAFLSRRFRPRFFNLASQPKLHFAGRFFGEGDRDNTIERSCPSTDQADDPSNEGCSLSGPSCRLDKKGRAKLLLDLTSRFSIQRSVMAALARPEAARCSPEASALPDVLVGAADNAEITEIALPLVRGRWKKWTDDGIPNRLSNFTGRGASTFIQRDQALAKPPTDVQK